MIYLIIAVIFLAVALVVVIINNHKIHKDIEELTRSIEAFVSNGTQIDISTYDNHFSCLQNAVTDLQELYLRERDNINKKSRQNTEFISDVSHQLKTPVAALRLYCEMEHAEHPNEHTQKELLLIEKMENLIYKLLRLEKIRSATYTMDFKYESMGSLCSEIIDEFRPIFPSKSYTVTGDSSLRLDRAWMYEALANIVKNASEHTDDDGTIAITVEDGEKSTSVYIRDNGGGVAPDDLPRLFKRFHRTDNANPNSAGIGLAITKAIIEKHHGTITAENTADGLAVIICLPHIDGYITMC